MQPNTTLAAHFTEAGLPPRDVQVMIAHAKFLADGGSPTRLLALAQASVDKDAANRAANAKPDEGQAPHACEGPVGVANVRQPDGDGAADREVSLVTTRNLSRPSPADRGGKGQSVIAGKAIKVAPTSVREPSKIERAAAITVARQSAATVKEWTLTVAGYGPWNRIAVGQLESIINSRIEDAASATRDVVIAKGASEMVPQGTPTTKLLRELIPDKAWQNLVQSAVVVARLSHAA